jgi:hypothetical protein
LFERASSNFYDGDRSGADIGESALCRGEAKLLNFAFVKPLRRLPRIQLFSLKSAMKPDQTFSPIEFLAKK